MKTKEEKAHDYAEALIDGFGIHGVPCDIKSIKRLVTEAHIAGAKEALESQWRPVNESPEEWQDVLIYTTYIGANSGEPRTLVEQMTFLSEYGFKLKENTERHVKLRILAWMPIPPIIKG